MSLTQINKAGLDEIALDHVFTIGASGNSAYTFQGEGLNGTVNNPTLYLTRGKTYRFENGSGGHPIRIQSTSGASGTAYNTGVTNNASAGTVIVEVQHDAPDVLYYQCTSHAAMNGILYVTGALADGSVTTAKLASSAVGAGNLQTASVETAKIQDQAVTLAKLEHGTSSNDGKFLRANNGADPSFELIPSAAISAVANDGANRVLTSDGDGTATAESSLTVDSSGNVGVGTTSPESELSVDGGVSISSNNVAVNPSGYDLKIRSNSSKLGIHTDNSSGTPILEFGTGGATGGQIYTSQATPLRLGTNSSENMRVHSDGNVGIGTTAPLYPLHVKGTVSESSPADYGVMMGLSSGDDYAQIQLNGDTGAFIDFSTSGVDQKGRILYNHSNNQFQFFVNSAHMYTFTGANGSLELIDGDVKLANGHGIDFSATSNETGSTTELLDDYERGNFSPTWLFSPNNSTGTTYNSNEGTYVKVGRMVYFTLHLWLSNKGSVTGAGYAQVQGLPFAVDGNGGFGVIAYYDNFGSYNPAVARVTPSEQIYIAQHNSGGYSQDLQLTHMNNSSRIYVGGCYSTTA